MKNETCTAAAQAAPGGVQPPAAPAAQAAPGGAQPPGRGRGQARGQAGGADADDAAEQELANMGPLRAVPQPRGA